MKLLYSPSSPYARKALVVARLKGVAVEVETVATSPTNRNETLYAQNPLGKIPCLMDGDRALYDSRTITAFLDAQNGPSLHEVKGHDRFHSMTMEALADGLLDAALLCRYEVAVRPQALRWDEWLNGQNGKIDSAIAEMERHWLPFLQAGDSIGAVAAGCALGYVSFRFPENGWAKNAPKLAAWHEKYSRNAVMAETAPPVS